MTRFLLIRHATVDLEENMIAGRSPGIHLSAVGRKQAEHLADELAHTEIRAVYSSPRARAQETAQIIAEARNVEVEVAAPIDEIDYGEWTGINLEVLAAQPRWRAFNSIRSCTRIPGGEHISEVQTRAIAFIHGLHEQFPKGSVALVSHSDVIRAVLIYYLAVPLDLMLRVQIGPASMTALELASDGPSILCVNQGGMIQL
jgi:broad specificity phosphatase PhoE